MPILPLDEFSTDVVAPSVSDAIPADDFNRLSVAKRRRTKSPVKKFVEGVDEGASRSLNFFAEGMVAFGEYVRDDKTFAQEMEAHRKLTEEQGPQLSSPTQKNLPRQLGTRLITKGHEILQKNEKALKERFPDGEPDFIRDLGKGVTSLGTALGISAVFGPGAAGVAFGVGERNSAIVEATSKGKSFKEAERIGNVLGFATGGLEFWGLHSLIVAKGGVIQRAIKGYVSEALQESSQSIAGSSVRLSTGLREFKGEESIKEALQEALYEGAIGGVLGSSTSIPITFALRRDVETVLREKGASAKEASAQADTLMKLSMDEVMTAVEEFEVPNDKPKKVSVKNFQLENISDTVANRLEKKLKEIEKVEGQKADETKTVKAAIEDVNSLIKEVKATKKEFKSKEDFDTVIQQLTERKQELTNTKDQLKPLTANRQQRVELRKQFQTATQALRQGKVEARKETKQVQDFVVQLVNSSGLTAKDKAKFLSTVKNVQTVEQLNKRQEDIELRISTLENREAFRQTKAKIKAELAPKKVKSTKKSVKFTPETQAMLDKLSRYSKLTKQQAAEAIQANLILPDNQAFEASLDNQLLSLVAGFEELTDPTRLNDILQEVRAIKREGRSGRLARIEKQKQEDQKKLETVLKVIAGDKPFDEFKGDKREGGAISAIKGFFLGQLGWENKLDTLASDDKTSKVGESALVDVLGVSDEITAGKKGIRIQGENIRNLFKEAFGFQGNSRKVEKQMLKQIRQDTKRHNLGTFTNRRGKSGDLEISRAEARKIWMEMQDPTLVESLTGRQQQADGTPLSEIRGNAYSDSMIDAIFNWLSDEDIDFAKAQMNFYRQYFDEVNKVYQDLYGVSLPFNRFYTPIAREGFDSDVTSDFLQEAGYRLSIASSGSLKDRVKNLHEIKRRNDVQVLQSHILEMEEFKAKASKKRDLLKVFGNGEVKSLINQKFGPSMTSSLNLFIKDFVSSGTEKAKGFEKAADFFRINFTRSALAIKPAITAKQLVSFIAFADNIPTKNFLSGVDDFLTNPTEAIRILSQSEEMKSRGRDFTRDVRDAYKTEEFAAFRQNSSLANMLMLTTKIGDKGAIYLGGWSVYKYHREQGKTHEQALREFERAANPAQQSSNLDQLSDWQRGGAFPKLFTMFTSAQNQYFRKEVDALRGLITKRLPPSEVAKKLFIYHFALPMLFQWVADLGKWDEKNQLRAGVLGSLNGIFILKDVLWAVTTAAINLTNDEDDDDLRIFDNEIDALNFGNGVVKAMRTLDTDDILMEDILEASEELLKESIGPISGAPVKQLFDAYEGLKDINEGETAKGTLKLLGWSPFIVDKRFEED